MLCKEQDDEEIKIKFLFDMFSDFQSEIKPLALKDFAEIFKIPLSEFPEGKIDYDDFCSVVEEYEIDYN